MRIHIEVVDQIYPERFYPVPDLRACQRVELDRGLALVAVERFVIGVNRRMKIYLAGFRREVVERKKKISLAHSTALKIAVYPLGKGESAFAQLSFHITCQAAKQNRVNALLKNISAVKLERKFTLFDRHSHMRAAILCAQIKCGVKDHRMNVKMKMAVDVRKLQTCRVKLFKLSGEFFSQLAARSKREEIFQSSGSWVVGEVARIIDQSRNLRMRQRASPDHRHQMNPNRKSRIRLRKLDSLLGRRAGDHQARACQHPILESANDCFVDFLGCAEVVRVHDQTALQGRPRRGCLRRSLVVDRRFGQKRTSAASTLRSSARLCFRSWMRTAHRLA